MSLRLRMLLSSRFPRSSNTAYHPSPPPPPLPSRPRFRLEHTRRQRGLLSDTRPSSRLTRRIRRITRATCSPLRRCRLLRPRAPRRFSLRPRTSAPRSARSLHLSSLSLDNPTTTFGVARLSSRETMTTTQLFPDMITLPSAMDLRTNCQVGDLCRRIIIVITIIIIIVIRHRRRSKQNRTTLPTVVTRRQPFPNTPRLTANPRALPTSLLLSPCTTPTLPRSPVGPKTAMPRFSRRSRLVAQTILTRRSLTSPSRRTTSTTARTCI